MVNRGQNRECRNEALYRKLSKKEFICIIGQKRNAAYETKNIMCNT